MRSTTLASSRTECAAAPGRPTDDGSRRARLAIGSAAAASASHTRATRRAPRRGRSRAMRANATSSRGLATKRRWASTSLTWRCSKKRSPERTS